MDWVALLDDHHIPYVTRGPNTKKGEVSVKCPYCGEDDPSEHLGINLTAENWGCHRSAEHRGHSPSRLIAALLGCSSAQAKLIAAQYSKADPETFDQAVAVLTGISEPLKAAKGHSELTLPDDFRAIKRKGTTARFWNYLESRGFDDVADLCFQYDLKCALTGDYKDRIIIPFYERNKLIGWTGRAIQTPINAPRYLSSSGAVKHTVFNADALRDGGKLLFIVEGPFDALKLDYYGEPSGARATCVFGTSMSIDQLGLLSRLRHRFKKVVILFDTDAIEASFSAVDWLHASNVVVGQLPDGVKDPGELLSDGIDDLINTYR